MPQHRRVAESNQQVAFLDSAERGGTVCLDRGDPDRGFRGQPVKSAQSARPQLDVVAGDSDVGAASLAVLDQMARDPAWRFDRYRKADALCGQDDRRFDGQSHPPRELDQRGHRIGRDSARRPV